MKAALQGLVTPMYVVPNSFKVAEAPSFSLHPYRNQAVLCQSIANLQVLVNAKIHVSPLPRLSAHVLPGPGVATRRHLLKSSRCMFSVQNLMMEKRQLETRIPTPPSAVRPVSARTKAASRIPSPAMSPQKIRVVTGSTAAAVSHEARHATQVPTSNLRGGEVARQPEAGRLSPAESQDFFSTPPHSNTDSPLRLQRTYSGASGGSCDIRDSTEVGLGQLREVSIGGCCCFCMYC